MTGKISVVMMLSFLVLFLCQSCQKDEWDDPGHDPEILNDGWEISTADAQGMDPAVVENVYREAGSVGNLYSLLVV